MTLNDLLTTIPISNFLDNVTDIYRELDPSILDDKWVNALSKKLEMSLAPILNYELLYDEIASVNILQNIIGNYFENIYMRFVNYTMMINKQWTDMNNYTDTVSNETNGAEGYAGFNVSNQDSDFRKVKNTSTTTSQDKLRYLQFFNQELNQWGLDIMNEIKRRLLVTIY